ncbi:MAG: TolB family protein, partial [bacterium]
EEVLLQQPQRLLVRRELAWSPDSNYLLVEESGWIWTVRTTDEEFGSVKQIASGLGAFWSVDSQQVFFSQNRTGWYVIDNEGGGARPQFAKGGAAISGAQSPNGARLAFGFWIGIGIVDQQTGEEFFVPVGESSTGGAVHPLLWSPDSETLLVWNQLSISDLRAELWKFEDLPEVSNPVVISDVTAICGWSRDGSRFMYQEGIFSEESSSWTYSLVLYDLETGERHVVSSYEGLRKVGDTWHWFHLSC